MNSFCRGKVISSGSGYISSTLSLEPNEKREDNEEISVLDVGGKPQRIIPVKTHTVNAHRVLFPSNRRL